MEQMDNRIDLISLIFRILRSARRLWLWLIPFVLVTAGVCGFVRWYTYRPVYEASVTFTVKVANPLYASVNAYNEKTAEQMEKTFPYILTSTALRQRVQEYLGTNYVPEVTAEVEGKSNIFTMKVRDPDPQYANQVLEAVMACYLQVADFVVGDTRLVQLDASGVPVTPINAFHVSRALSLGAAVGCILWILFCTADSMLRATVLHEEDLKNLLNIPCLCSIPVTKVVGKMTCPLIHRDRGREGFGEAIRMLRIRMEKQMAQMEKKVLLVSSANSNEGKTTVSVNLAISLAQSGKKVLILDCDMYNPSVAKAFHSQFGSNRRKIKLPESNLSATLYGVAMKNLYTVLFAEPDEAAPRQINAKELSYLLEHIKAPFDYIILDTPPCTLIGEVMEVAEVADCGILVVRQDFSSKDKVLEGARLLADCGLPMIGCVLNGVEGNITPGGYRYGYGYGYGYRYGYGYGYGYGDGSDGDSEAEENQPNNT